MADETSDRTSTSMSDSSRRAFLQRLALGAIGTASGAAWLSACASTARVSSASAGKAGAASELDGTTDCSSAIAKALAACTAAGGGQILIPAGAFLTGPIHLASKMELHVARNATLLVHTDPSRYLPAVLTRFEGVELCNYSR